MCNCSRQNQHLLEHIYLTLHLLKSTVQEKKKKKKKLLGFSPICSNCPLSVQKQGVVSIDDGGADVTGCICGSAGKEIY